MGLSVAGLAPLESQAQDSGAAIEFQSFEFFAFENEGPAVVTVVRSGEIDGSMSVDYDAAPEFALAGEDFVPTSGTLTFAPGETEATFEVTYIDDAIPEGSEPIALTLSNPTNGGFLGPQNAVRLFIQDNDRRGTLLDASFDGFVLPTDFVSDLALLPDGKILAVGEFLDPATGLLDRVLRFNPDGSRDDTFDLQGTGPNDVVAAVAVQSDGKILIAGLFTEIGGVGRARIARLDADGALDENFDSGIGPTGDLPFVFNMYPLADGKIMVAGRFSDFDDTGRGVLVRLNENGSVDSSFDTGDGIVSRDADFTGPWVSAVGIHSDGKLVIGGQFTEVGGEESRNVARLNANGSFDSSFFVGNGAVGPGASVEALAVLEDGKILIGGDFVTYDGNARNGIARLLSDGSHDETFDPGEGAQRVGQDGETVAGLVDEIFAMPDGRIVLTGAFDSIDTFGRLGIGRILPDGRLDSSFGPFFGTTYRDRVGNQEYDRVFAAALQPDGKIVTGATFETADGLNLFRLSRLLVTNDTTATVEFGRPRGSVPETGGMVEIGVVRRGISSAAVSVDYFIIGGTATAGVDYETVSGTIEFAALETDKSFSVPILSDGVTEPTENFEVALRNPRGGVRIAEPVTVIVEIVDSTTPGNVDFSFAPVFLPSAADASTFPPVTEIEVLDNGQILVAGFFTFVDTVDEAGEAVTLDAAGLIRANPDGTIDQTFNAEAPEDSVIVEFRSMDVRPDGRILGGFRGVSLLEPDGARTDGFMPRVEDLATVVVMEPDGGFVVSDNFADTIQGIELNEVVRFNPDGTPDAGFLPVELNDWAVSGLVQQDGKIVLGGWFTDVNGVGQNRLIRLNDNGTRDPGFDIGTGFEGVNVPAAVFVVHEQPDGKLLVGGQFVLVNGVPRSNLVRLNPDGSVDESFDIGTGPNLWVGSLAVQDDGKILAGGGFFRVNGIDRPGLVRFNADGSLDETFAPSLTYDGLNGNVTAIAVQEDGQILVGGTFIRVNGLLRPGLARLNGDDVIELQPPVSSAPPVLTGLPVGDSGRFRFEFTAQPGVTYTIEGTVDLVTWETVETITADEPTESYEATGLATTPFRFFRVVAP